MLFSAKSLFPKFKEWHKIALSNSNSVVNRFFPVQTLPPWKIRPFALPSHCHNFEPNMQLKNYQDLECTHRGNLLSKFQLPSLNGVPEFLEEDYNSVHPTIAVLFVRRALQKWCSSLSQGTRLPLGQQGAAQVTCLWEGEEHNDGGQNNPVSGKPSDIWYLASDIWHLTSEMGYLISISDVTTMLVAESQMSDSKVCLVLYSKYKSVVEITHLLVKLSCWKQ